MHSQKNTSSNLASATDTLRMVIAGLVLLMCTVSIAYFVFDTGTYSRETAEKSELTILEGRILRYFSSRLSELQSLSGVIVGQYLPNINTASSTPETTNAAILNLIQQSVFREFSIINLRGYVTQSYGAAKSSPLRVGTGFPAERWFIDIISTRRPQIGSLVIDGTDTHFFILAVPIFDEKNTLQAVAVTRDDASFFGDVVLNYKSDTSLSAAVYATDETGRLVVSAYHDLVDQEKVVAERIVVRHVLQSGQFISSGEAECYIREDGTNVTASGQYILSALMAIFIEKPCTSKYVPAVTVVAGGAVYLLVQVALLHFVRRRTQPVA